MTFREIIERRLRTRRKGVNAAIDVDAVVAANVGKGGGRTRVSSTSRHRVVQKGGRTVVDEHEHRTSSDPKGGSHE